MDAVVVENLVHTYPAQRPSRVARQALNGISFTVREGETFGLLGPNGGGKSTTFHILSTYFPPTGGRVLVLNHDVTREPDVVRRALGVVFQSPGLDRQLTVRENLTHQGHLYGVSGPTLERRINSVLSRLGLNELGNDLVDTLSGGLKRRVELAKGLLHQPQLLLLDEPSTGLDPGARRDMWDYLTELKKADRVTMVVTTHLMEEAEKCDRVAILHEGSLVALGTPADLKKEIGGDIISVETADPEGLRAQIEKKFGVKVQVVENVLRIERASGHEFIPQLVTAFPGQIASVTLGKPTLEDVFIKKTGHRFWNNPPTEGAR